MTPTALSTADILQRFELIRRTTVRSPLEVAELGGLVIERGWANSRTEEGQLLPVP